MIKRAPLEIPLAIARQFMADLQAYYAEVDPVKRDEIASRQLYGTAALLVHILKQCGDDLTRQHHETGDQHQGYVADLALPSMTNSTTPDDWRIHKQFQMMKFDGQRWFCSGQS